MHGLLFLFENGDFFLRFDLLSTRIWWKRVTRKASFQKHSPVWRCLIVLLYSFGLIKQRLLKTITPRSWIPVNAHAPIKDSTVYSCMYCWRAKPIQKHNVWTQICRKTEKKISKFKQNQISVVGALRHWHKNLLTNEMIFLHRLP